MIKLYLLNKNENTTVTKFEIFLEINKAEGDARVTPRLLSDRPDLLGVEAVACGIDDHLSVSWRWPLIGLQEC